MKILVTGSTGCLGMSLQNVIANSYDVNKNEWVYSNSSICNLENLNDTINYFKTVSPDFIIHLAGYIPSFYDNINYPTLGFTKNIRINENVLEASYKANIKNGIFCSSVSIFPDVPADTTITEELSQLGNPNKNVLGYGYAKRMLEIQCINYNKQYGAKYICIIPGNIYGKYDKSNSGKLISNIIYGIKKSIDNNEIYTINGTGLPLRQFIYADDLSKIIISIINAFDLVENNKSIICINNEEISIFDIVKKIAHIMNHIDNFKFDLTKPDGCIKRTMSNNYLKNILGKINNSFEFTSLDEGLVEIINALFTN